MHGIEHFKQFSHVEAVGTNLYFKCPQSPVIYRRVACVIHQAHSLCLPETSRCIGEHCGLHWSTTCFYMVHTENTVSTTKCHRKFLFLTSLPNRTTIYNYVKRFRATGSISDNITRGGYVLEKNCARQEDRGRPRRTDCTRTASERLHRLQPNSHLAWKHHGSQALRHRQRSKTNLWPLWSSMFMGYITEKQTPYTSVISLVSSQWIRKFSDTQISHINPLSVGYVMLNSVCGVLWVRLWLPGTFSYHFVHPSGYEKALCYFRQDSATDHITQRNIMLNSVRQHNCLALYYVM